MKYKIDKRSEDLGSYVCYSEKAEYQPKGENCIEVVEFRLLEEAILLLKEGLLNLSCWKEKNCGNCDPCKTTKKIDGFLGKLDA